MPWRWRPPALPVLALTAVAAVLLFYNATHTPEPSKAPARSIPDWQGRQVTVWQLSQDGQQVLQADAAVHFKPDLTRLTGPRGHIQRNGSQYWFTARQGRQTQGIQTLEGEVIMLRLQPGRPRTLLTAGELSYTPAQHRLDSCTTVTIRQQNNWLQGTGMTLWLNDEHLILKRKVTSHYEPAS